MHKKKHPLHTKKAHEVKSAADAHVALQKLWEHNALSTRHSRVNMNQQDGAAVARHAHNVEAVGSTPTPATK
jgi:hypothetical protein